MTWLLVAICIPQLGGCSTQSESESTEKQAKSLDRCWTQHGWADWSGSCLFGKASGTGTAIYHEDHIGSIRGHFEAGIPVGKVMVKYDGGGTYEGGLKDGEYDGFGMYRASWGEGYDGDWIAGFQNGEGTYIASDGRRIPGLWERGRLIGSWYSDGRNGCKVWWRAGDDPVGKLNWSGACRNGKAEGTGTVEWLDESSPPVRFVVTFNGALRAGKLNGQGKWVATDHFKNVIHQETLEGVWRDGAMVGRGRKMKTSQFLDGSYKASMDRYEGEFDAGRYSGNGLREDVNVHNDGMIKYQRETGQFLLGSLHGTGTQTRFRRELNGLEILDRTEGRHAEMQFVGFGRRITQSREANGTHSSVVFYARETKHGGSGVVQYSDGGVFKGAFDAMGAPTDGFCVLRSPAYIGRCQTVSRKTLSYSQQDCLTHNGKCLKVIATSIF